MTDERARMQAMHAKDEAWAQLRPYYHAIKRIADDGPDDSVQDYRLIRAVFNAVTADIEFEAAERLHIENSKG